MATFARSDELQAAEFVDANLRGARFVRADDRRVGGRESSFAQTLRHLVMATGTWLGRAILEAEQPFHPMGAAAVAVRAGALPGPCGTNASSASRTRVLA